MDVSVAAQKIKSLLGIKFSRAGQRHASAMGYPSINHLLEAVKAKPVECEFEHYIGVLKAEILAKHQVTISDELIEQLRHELVQE